MNALFYLHQKLVKHGKPTCNQHINDKKKNGLSTPTL
jgi:hypothetical protein